MRFINRLVIIRIRLCRFPASGFFIVIADGTAECTVITRRFTKLLFRFRDDEVFVKRSGGGVLLLPKKITYEQIMAVVSQFKGKFERRQPKDQKRKWR